MQVKAVFIRDIVKRTVGIVILKQQLAKRKKNNTGNGEGFLGMQTQEMR